MRRSLGSIALAIAITLAVASACVPTAGVPITLTLAFEGSERSFVTASGWEVELTEARAVLGPVYAYAPSGATALRRALGPAQALAHAGHLIDGRVVRAELLEPRVIDALAPVADVATLDGLAGELDALRITLAPGDTGGPTHGHVAWVAGVARREGEAVAFEGGLDLEGDRLRTIDGVAAGEGATLDEGARLVVGADARAWLAEADFSALAGGAITADSQPHRALYLGVRSAASWRARVELQTE